jgi:Domain of unknown function (DUF4386)
MDRLSDMSPKAKARLAGIFYLLNIATAAFSQGFVSDKLILPGDASTTAANILSHEPLFRAAFAVYLFEMACQITVTVLFYYLLKPVSRGLSMLAAVLSLTGCVIKTVSRLFFIAPLLVLGGEHYLNAFGAEQLQAQALLFLNINDMGAGVALVFFGFSAPLRGYLIFRSTFLPKFLGILSILAGIGWTSFAYRPLAHVLMPFILPLGLLGSAAMIFWLLAFGVNEERWKQMAAAEATSIWR